MKPMNIQCNRWNIIIEVPYSRLDTHEDIADRQTVYHRTLLCELYFWSRESQGECLISGLRSYFMIAFLPVGAVSFSCTPSLQPDPQSESVSNLALLSLNHLTNNIKCHSNLLRENATKLGAFCSYCGKWKCHWNIILCVGWPVLSVCSYEITYEGSFVSKSDLNVLAKYICIEIIS